LRFLRFPWREPAPVFSHRTGFDLVRIGCADCVAVQMPLAVLRGFSALMRSDVLCESSECDFRAALRLNRLIAQTSEIDARLP
jgi:hypothetical protein